MSFFPIVQGSAGGSESAMVMVWRTTSAAETVTLPALTINAEIDWGDGNVTTETSDYPFHEYATAGDHTVTITGACAGWYQLDTGDKLKLIELLNLGVMGWTSLSGAFYGNANLTHFTAGNTDISGCSSLSSFLRACPLTCVYDFTGFNVSTITNWDRAFGGMSGTGAAPDISTLSAPASNLIYRMFSASAGVSTAPDLSLFDDAPLVRMESTLAGLGVVGEVGDIGLTSWDVSRVSKGDSFASGLTFTTAEYDAILEAWSQQTFVNSGWSLHMGNSKYTNSTARAILTSAPNNIVLTDGGPA